MADSNDKANLPLLAPAPQQQSQVAQLQTQAQIPPPQQTAQPVVQFFSRSYPTRQFIEPTTKRLREYLNEIGGANLQPIIDPGFSAEQNIAKLEELAQWVHNAIKRVVGAISVINQKNQQWQELMMALQGEELNAENAVYNSFSQGGNGFIAIVTQGMEATDMLESRLAEIDHTINRLKYEEQQSTLGAANVHQSQPPPPWMNPSFTQSSQSYANPVANSTFVQSSPLQPSAVKVHLPKLQLPMYYGDPLKWIEYWDAFEAAVHNQPIPDVQKFNYLLSTLKNSAYKSVEGMSVTNANYKNAVEVLKKRFGDPTVIKRALYGELRSLPVATEKTNDLRHSLEGIDRVCRQLESLGEDIDHPNLIIQIQEKLPSNVIIELEKTKKPDDTWKMSKLRQELDNLVRFREVAFQVQHNTPTHSQPRSPRPIGKPASSRNHRPLSQPHSSTQTFTVVNPQSARREPGNSNATSSTLNRSAPRFLPSTQWNHPCVFCNGNHFNDSCNIVKNIPDRVQKVKDLRLCLRCLRPGHFSSVCVFEKPCFHCRGNHNQALCDAQRRAAFPSSYQSNSLPPQRQTTFQRRENNFVPQRQSYVPPRDSNFVSQRPSNSATPSSNANVQRETFTPRGVQEMVQQPRAQTHSVIQEYVQSPNRVDQERLAVNTTETVTTTEATEVLQSKITRSYVSLLTAKLKIENPKFKHKSVEAYALFDSGSQRSFITNRLMQKLQLPDFGNESIIIHTFAAKNSQEMKTLKTEIAIELKNGSIKALEVNAVPKLTNELSIAAIKPEDLQVIESLHIIDFADNVFVDEKLIEPDLLIGADYFWEFLDQQKITRLPSGMFLVPSSVGVLISGRRSIAFGESSSEVCTVTPLLEASTGVDVTFSTGKGLEQTPILETFWDLETIGIKDNPEEKDDDLALNQFNATIRFCNGRYEVKWPWKSENPELPDNYGLSYGRLKSLMRRFQAEPELLQKYDEIIQDQLNKGIIETVDKINSENTQHYLPNHPVITPQKATTKVRIVYDASARVRKGANSLNDCLYRGPIIMPDLCGMLIRFRMYPVAFVADVEKAFLQISLQEPDRDVTRFLWLKQPTKPEVEGNLQIYRFCRVAFGVISSPFLLNATLQYHLMQEGTENMLRLAQNIYVDNVLMGADSVEKANEIYTEAKSSFSKASMNLREWTSNSEAFCQIIKEEDLLIEKETKVLGLLWDTKSDVLKISLVVEKDSWKEDVVVTKRSVLKQIASTFDPLGFLSPILLVGKLFLQSLWKEKLEWDEPVPPDIARCWTKILYDWSMDSRFYLCRRAPHASGENVEYQLITFVDASTEAYATVVYLRTKDRYNVTNHIIFSKSRLAPVKHTTTIPRLELLAVLIGVRATKFVEEQIGLNICKKTIFTDSECVLHWLKSTKPLGTFIENRLKEIRLAKDVHFCFVSGKENPADFATRGMLACDFDNLLEWWHGPMWLERPPEEWPVRNLPAVTPEILERISTEIGAQPFDHAVLNVTEEVAPLVNLNRISNFTKARRVVVYVLRFLKVKVWNKLQNQGKLQHLFAEIKDNGDIEANEVEVAEKFLIKQAQIQVYPELVNSVKSKKWHSLCHHLGVKLDHDNILRCYGRLQNAPVHQDTKFPILLPRRNPLSKLIIQDMHRTVLHSGVNHTLSELRRKFWVPQGRAEVKHVLHGCFICRKYKTGPYRLPRMPPYPEEKVTQAKPFQFTGLDYLGPLWIKNPNEERKQIWICLFTCLVTRAIHLEPVFDLSVQTFLNCMRRFIARRGKPDKVISDNAAQFKVTQVVMGNVWKDIVEDPALLSYFSSQKIHWQYITELAPWQGGFYERHVGLVKQCIRKTVGRQLLNFEAFFTLIVEVEAVLNTRPLTYSQDEVDSYKVLRPIDFLCPQGEIGIPPMEGEEFSNKETYPKVDSAQKLHKYWQQNLLSLESFWKIWQTEYLLSLRERTQVTHRGPRIQNNTVPQVDDIVLIKDENTSRGNWKIAKVVDTHISPDDQVRTVKVLLPNKIVIKRPISLLYPLEIPTKSSASSSSSSSVETSDSSSFTTILQNMVHIHFKCPVGILFFLLFCLLVLPTTATTLHSHMCPLLETLKTVHSQSCVHKGIVVKRTVNNTLCWLQAECPVGHLSSNGTCGPICQCPSWADDCSNFKGPKPQPLGDQEQILAFSQPLVCSFKPDPRCKDLPLHTEMFQIQLFDNSTHFVNSLTLSYSTSLIDEFFCLGDGPQVGTPQFCKNHTCAQFGTKFCYYPRNELVKFVNEEGEIPVKAWGSVPVTYYGHKDKLDEVSHCLQCSLKCIQGGLLINSDPQVNLIEVCAAPYCYKLSEPRLTEQVIFPKDIIIHNHEFTVQMWSKGYVIKHSGIQCPASPFCEMITCNFCLENVKNPQCIPQTYFVITLAILYFSAGTIYVSIRLSKTLCTTCCHLLNAICSCLRFCRILARRARNQTYERVVLPIHNAIQAEDNQEITQAEVNREIQGPHINLEFPRFPEPNVPEVSARRFSFKPTPRGHQIVIIIYIIFVFTPVIKSCSEITSLLAQKSVCTINANGATECILSETTRLSLVPQGQQACLLIKDPIGEPIGTIVVEVNKVTVECQTKNEYYTRSFAMKASSSKRCPNMGSCSGNKCDDIKSDTKVSELNGIANDSPGFTYCVESCGCAGCGCFYCTSGCLFYQTFAQPVTDTVYEVFSCPVWEYKVQLSVQLNTQNQNNSKQRTFELRPGIAVKWEKIKIAIPSISSPPVPVLGSQFLTDGTRTVMVRASASGQPVSNTIGELQCASKEKASKFECYLPHDACICQNRETLAVCHCSERQLESLFQHPEHLLPLNSQGISITGKGNKVEAEYNHIASLELQISMEGFHLSTKIEKNNCQIKPLSFSGCYSCYTGAKLQFECRTDFGETLAHVTCGAGSFATICTSSGVSSTATMNFPNAVIKETCLVFCPAGTSNFQLEGILSFIEKERSGNLSNVMAAKNAASSVDLGFLASWLTGKWYIGLLLIILAIVLIPITIICFPLLLQLIITSTRNFQQTLGNRASQHQGSQRKSHLFGKNMLKRT